MDGHDGGHDGSDDGGHDGGGHGGHEHGHSHGNSHDLADVLGDIGDHGAAHGHNGHDMGHVDAHGVGHGACQSSFGFGFVSHALEAMGIAHGANCGFAEGSHPGCGVERRVRMPGLMMASKTVQVLVWPHGKCDTLAMFNKLAPELGLINLFGRKRGIEPSNTTEDGLRDTTPFDGRDGTSPMPSGWVPGTKDGMTRFWQQFYQLGEKRHFWNRPDINLERSSYLSVSCCTWYFGDFGDYETRLAMTVRHRPYWQAGSWHERTHEIAPHLVAARKMGEKFFNRLKPVRPHESAIVLRNMQAKYERVMASRRTSQPIVQAPVARLVDVAASIKITGPGPVSRRFTASPGADLLQLDMAGKAT